MHLLDPGCLQSLCIFFTLSEHHPRPFSSFSHLCTRRRADDRPESVRTHPNPHPCISFHPPFQLSPYSFLSPVPSSAHRHMHTRSKSLTSRIPPCAARSSNFDNPRLFEFRIDQLRVLPASHSPFITANPLLTRLIHTASRNDEIDPRSLTATRDLLAELKRCKTRYRPHYSTHAKGIVPKVENCDE